MKKFILFIISAAFLTGCQARKAEIQVTESPDYTAIAKAASEAGQQYTSTLTRAERTNNLIPMEFWGDAIEQLKPIRVVYDVGDIGIVMRENEQSEEGYYFISAFSSPHLLFGKTGDVTLTRLTFHQDVDKTGVPGTLHYYKIRKN